MAAEHGFRYHKWLVLMSACLVYCHIIGLSFALSSLFPTVMEKFGVTRAKASLLLSVYASAAFGGGVLYGALTDKYGPKWIGLLGASLSSVSLFISFWASSLTYLVICIGAVKGCGAGICMVTTSVAVRQHFTGKLCVLALSILVSSSGVGGMVLIYLIRYLSDTYGLNGTLLILCGMDMTCAVMALLWAPPKGKGPVNSSEYIERGSKGNEQDSKFDNNLTETDTESCKKECDQTNIGKINRGFDEEQVPAPVETALAISNEEGESGRIQYKMVLECVDIKCQHRTVNTESSYIDDEAVTDVKSQTRTVRLDTNVGNDHENVPAVNMNRDINTKVVRNKEAVPQGLKDKLVHILRVKSFVFTLIGLTFSLNCSILFLVFIVDIMMDSGYTETEGALGLTMLTVTNILGRIAHGTLLPCPFDTTFVLPIIATALSTVAMVSMAFNENLVVYYILCCFLGNGFGVHISIVAVTSAQILDIQYLPYAMGLLITVSGLPNLAVGPIAGISAYHCGAIRDVTGTYTTTILIAAAMNGIGLIMFILANCCHTKKAHI